MKLTRLFRATLVAACMTCLLARDAEAQRRRRERCTAEQHQSAGHCCNAGEEWVEARNACVCLEAGGCQSAQPAQPAPPPPPPPPTCADGMVLVQGASFMMGSVQGQGEADETPAHRVTLDTYCIDRHEVSVAQFRQCAQAGTCGVFMTVNLPGLSPQDATLFNQYCNGGRGDRDNHPMNCLDWAQADAYCRWRGGRLPSEAEWELAARGTEQRVYPWGNAAPTRLMLNACDADCRSNFERPGRPRPPAIHDSTDGFTATAPVGTFSGGASPYGALDMAGNVFEWTADWYGPYNAAPANNPHGPTNGTNRVARGGHWFSGNAANVRGADRVEALPVTRLATLGFRCAADPGAGSSTSAPAPAATEPAPPPAATPVDAGAPPRRR
jgi:formylglycine-generating enzyme required for sulfatase activity